MITENAEEEQKKMISTGSNRPFDYSFGTALTAAEGAGESVKGGKSNVGPVVQGLGKTCKSCHDEYRAKND